MNEQDMKILITDEKISKNKELVNCYNLEHLNNNYDHNSKDSFCTKNLKTSYYEVRTIEYSPIDHITINYDF